MRRRLGLTIVLGALIAATVALHRLATTFPVGAINQGPLEIALGSVARLLGLAIAYWLLASTLFYLLASLARLPRVLRAMAPFIFRPIRRLIDGALASGLTMALALPTYATVTSAYVPVPASDPPSASDPGEASDPAAEPITTTTSSFTTTTLLIEIPTTTREPPPPDVLYLPIETAPATVATADRLQSVEADHVVVMPGDNMWLLAERRLTALLGRAAGDHEVAPYWLAVIGANKDRIRSGDPDLIFPGEVLVLPGWDLG